MEKTLIMAFLIVRLLRLMNESFHACECSLWSYKLSFQKGCLQVQLNEMWFQFPLCLILVGGFPHPPLSFLVKLPPFVGLTDWIQRPIKASLIPWAHLDHEKQRNGSRLKASISIKYDTASDLIELMDPIAKERPNAYDEYWQSSRTVKAIFQKVTQIANVKTTIFFS